MISENFGERRIENGTRISAIGEECFEKWKLAE